jgi:hypothetical protein
MTPTGSITRPRGLLREPFSAAPSGRRGVVVLFFAFFFIAFLGLCAVVVDLGIARTTQLQMQTSADVAALEGLLGRDARVPTPDAQRRQTASLLARLVFDEDLDPATGPDQYRLGAGLVLGTGVSGVNDPLGGVLDPGAPWVPSLQLNVASNLQSGDLVAGSFTALDATNPSRVDWHDEGSDYSRLDFSPEDRGTSFLARLRRTRPDQPLDRVAGVSSAGPTLPYLFGLGSAALGTPDPAAYDPRRDGITVRAAAIADARPVTAAGLARPGLPGLAPLATGATTSDVHWLSFDAVAWAAIPARGSFTAVLDGNGVISGTAAGAAVAGSPRRGALTVEGPVLIPGAPSPELDGLAYASLHTRDPASGALQIRDFVAVQIEVSAVEAGPTLRIVGIKLDDTVAPANATAQPTAASLPSIPPVAPNDARLLAPVLAR